MLSKSLSVIPVARRALFQNTPAIKACTGLTMRLAHHGPPADYRQPTMDDIPVPCGSWKENYENNQRKYNVQLVFGSGFFVLTLIVGIYSGAFNFYYSCPSKPAGPN